MSKVNQTIINFAVYEDEVEYYGKADIQLPDIKQLTQTISGAGIAGNVESVVMGHIEAMSLTISFRTVTSECVKLFEQREHHIEARVAQQDRDTTAQKNIVSAVKYVFNITPKGFNAGKVAPATTADASGEYAVHYYAMFIDGKKKIEIDQYNFIFIVGGVDYLAEVRKALGKA